MAAEPKRNKATSPSRNKSAGGRGTPKKKAAKKASQGKRKAVRKREPVRTPTEDAPEARKGLPARAERQGTRRIHSRELTPKEAKARQERREKRREKEVEAQQKERKEFQKQGKGWGALRRSRGGTRGR